MRRRLTFDSQMTEESSDRVVHHKPLPHRRFQGWECLTNDLFFLSAIAGQFLSLMSRRIARNRDDVPPSTPL